MTTTRLCIVRHGETAWNAEHRVQGQLDIPLNAIGLAQALAAGTAANAFELPADGTGWIALALLTVFYGTAITSTFVLLPKLGAVNNAAVLNFEPIAVLGLAWLILDQSVAPLQILGAFIVVGSIVWMGAGRR